MEACLETGRPLGIEPDGVKVTVSLAHHSTNRSAGGDISGAFKEERLWGKLPC